MNDLTQGDPKLTLTADGADLTFIGGQPVMERGLVNLVLISLFTRRTWCGNALTDDPAQKIGSDFEQAVDQPITLSALNEIRDAAQKAIMANEEVKSAEARVTNPESHFIRVELLIRTKLGQACISLEKDDRGWAVYDPNPDRSHHAA
ncbi:MAG: hypothetical protein GY874_02655 [Desulfobacteraceae bacterium]|nr:hypothetical protein [Desulfobacteraceae bacterium]